MAPTPLQAPALPGPSLPRRALLRLGALAGVSLLAGCQRGEGPTLLAVRGDMPAAWLRRLPDPWRLRSFDGAAALLAAAPSAGALLALSDGWAATLPQGRLQPLTGAVAALLGRLDPAAAAVSRLHGPAGAPVVAFPWAVTPWLLVLRGRPDLARRGAEGWDLLQDPSLRGRLVLPASPRVVIALAGGDGDRLRRLRRQAIACNDRDALSLLLNGDADAAVVPRQPVLPLLRRDPRLQALLLPGAPLSWSLLLATAGLGAAPPLAWLEQLLAAPLLPRLLAAGWVPPLPRRRLEPALAAMEPRQRQLLLPPTDLWQSCVSLPPLAPAERQRLQALWDGAAPEAGITAC
ncbi:MAG: twin-arginine translocation pathway signal [Synechococcaceae cyanobacterium]|jgi:hypothetical protein